MKNDERCGNCRFAQSVAEAETVECHKEPPKVAYIPTPQGLGIRVDFPRMPALTGWCGAFEQGEPVPYSRILRAGAATLKLDK